MQSVMARRIAVDAIQLIKSDHAVVERLFQRFERSKVRGTGAELRRIVRALVKELSIHAAVEEQLLYPALRPRGGAPGEVLEALEEHHVVKLTLRELERMDPADARYRAKMAVLAESVRRHVREEERELLPRLRRRLDPADLRELGSAMATLKKTAPTRPHPASPDEPPGNFLAGALAAVYDRSRDALRGLAERGQERGRESLQRGRESARELAQEGRTRTRRAARRGEAAARDLAEGARAAGRDLARGGRAAGRKVTGERPTVH
jgi:hemerythrin superfamily protein